jgi:hypothetical protein
MEVYFTDKDKAVVAPQPEIDIFELMSQPMAKPVL